MIVKTKYGMIQGQKESECYVFKGIPYAMPPINELRFKAPQKPEKFKGIYNANEFKARSAQVEWKSPDGFYDKEFYTDEVYKTPISEDSLYLNIWVPKINNNEKLPVLFYIHGGGFLGGTGHEVEFRTEEYAKQGIILVTINYRLGALGFLAHNWLKEESGFTGNYGILDQIAALEWVHENIDAFGGDSNNITICGQSAGAMSVESLLCTKVSNKKYNKAIIQSGSGYPQLIMKMLSLDEACEMGDNFIKYLGIKTLQELKSISIDKILEAQGKVVMDSIKNGQGLPYGTIIDGVILTNSIDKCVESGNIAKVPMIIGSTKNDITVTKEEVESENSRIHQSCIKWSLVNEEANDNPSYVYYFKRNLPGDNSGAFHSAELWYMFGTLDKCWRPMEDGDFELSNEMITYWSNFIKYGDPNNNKLELWEKCTSKNNIIKIFDVK